MKITSFQFTLRQAATKDGYGDNYYVNIDENGETNISHPYKFIPYKEQGAIFDVIRSAIAQYAILIDKCDKANRALKLEQYAPTVSSEEITSREEPKSAVPESCALGGGEVSTGIKDAPFEDPERPFGLSEEQIEVLKANKDVDELP